MNDKQGIVYILSNEAMPGLLKIGLTTRKDLSARLRELYTTGVPVPFRCEYACQVEDCGKVEDALHQAFSTDRVNPNREFFKVSLNRIVPLLELLGSGNIAGEVDKDLNQGVSESDMESSAKLARRRPPLNFEEMGIPIGGELTTIFENQEYKVIVSGARVVKYENAEMSLTAATKAIRHIEYAIQPTRFWTYPENFFRTFTMKFILQKNRIGR